MESDHSPIRRGSGRERLESAIRELLDEATLVDLVRFITASRLVDRSGTSNGALYKASKGPADLASRTIANAAGRTGPSARALYGQLGSSRPPAEHDPEPHGLTAAIADHLLDRAVGSGRIDFTAKLLAAAVSCSDPEAAHALRDFYADGRARLEPVLEAMLAARHREPIDEFDTATMALLFTALGDGLALRARFDGSVSNEVARRALLALWTGTTRSVGCHDEDLLSRLLPVTSHGRRPASCPEARQRCVQAVRDIYRQQGWAAVTISSVSRRTGATRAAIHADFGDRDGLAVAVWGSFLPSFERLVATDGRQALATRVEHFLTVLSERACEHPNVTQSLVNSFHRTRRHGVHGVPGRADHPRLDARQAVPLHVLLGGLLRSGDAAFRSGFLDTEQQAIGLARLMVDATLTSSLDDPDTEPPEVASYLTDVFLQGTLARRRSRLTA